MAIFFSKRLILTDVSVFHLDPGRVISVKANIKNTTFIFVNIYAHCTAGQRASFIQNLNVLLRQFDSNSMINVGGDWNCTLDYVKDRNGEESHLQSAALLRDLVNEHSLLDVWRELHPDSRQYSWVKVSDGKITAARLDRFYVRKIHRNRMKRDTIIPVGFSDHQLITIDMTLFVAATPSPYWKFNVRLVQVKVFCEYFALFWENWRLKKQDFDRLSSGGRWGNVK